MDVKSIANLISLFYFISLFTSSKVCEFNDLLNLPDG